METIFSGKMERVFLKKARIKNNVFTPVSGPVDLKNPMDFCWVEINVDYAEHIQMWQAMANESCKPYVTCITCPNSGGGLYIMYSIKPTSKKCAVISDTAVLYNFASFNFGDNQLDSEAVASVINPKK